jgi:hypothetical protein
MKSIQQYITEATSEDRISFDQFIKDLEKLVTNDGKVKIESDHYDKKQEPQYTVVKRVMKNALLSSGSHADQTVYDLSYWIDKDRTFELQIIAWDDPDKNRPRYSLEHFGFNRSGAPAKESNSHNVSSFYLDNPKIVSPQHYDAVKEQLSGLLKNWYEKSDLMEKVGNSYWSSPQKKVWIPCVNVIVGHWLKRPYKMD